MTKVYIVEKRVDKFYEGETYSDVYNFVLGVYKDLSQALKRVREDVKAYEDVEVYDKHDYCYHDDNKGNITEWMVVEREVI